MTKKGSVQQLQAEINTNDEFGKFLERDGLLVMDVYSDWCGPCLGMVGSLKKIKLELGGDDLHLAVCRSDDIDALKRFRKSEPTWLFVSSGKVVNILFGCNVPKLMRMITEELRLEKLFRSGEYERTFYEFTQLTPEEQELENKRIEDEKVALAIEDKAADQKRNDYIKHVTSQITTNLIDTGVVIFMSVGVKDNLKRVMDAAEALGMSCKERKLAQVTADMMHIINFNCSNPVQDSVWEKIYNRDIQVAIFRIADQETRTVEEVFLELIAAITLPQTVTTVNEGEDVQVICSPIVAPFQFVLKKEVRETENEDASVKLVEENISVPGAWTPANKETNAGLIYLFFRHLTEHFLPPDPTPEPPHLSMIYDAFKRNDIMEVYHKFKPFMLAYGYFTTDDVNATELIANTTDSYLKKKPMITDKLVLKVTKGSAEALVALNDLGPTYISPNTVIGHKECILFFPEGYTNLEEGEGVEEEVVEVSKKKKKRKKKKDEESSSVRNGEEVADISALDEAQDTADEKNSPTEEKSAPEDH